MLNNLEGAGQNIRKAYQRRLPSDYSKDYYFMHRNTGRTEPIIVEYGFLDGTGDDATQLKNNYRRYASAVVDAVLEYIGYNPNLDNGITYTVKPGDTLWSIAKNNNISVTELKSLNNLDNNLLKVGQQLLLRPNQTDNNAYIVKRGDTLYSIARDNNISVDDLKRFNNLNSNTLSVGQILLIPNGNIDNPSNNQNVYIVKPGDNLYSIAREYNTTVSELMMLNNLTTNLLNIGQELILPEQESKIYIVEPGDTLYSIALANNTTVQDLREKNGLTNNTISIGQILRI